MTVLIHNPVFVPGEESTDFIRSSEMTEPRDLFSAGEAIADFSTRRGALGGASATGNSCH